MDEPEEFTVLHWHTDTYDLPEGSVRLFRSAACQNQAFQYNDNVLALQFHLEMDEEGLQELVSHSLSELFPGQYIQSKEKINEGTEMFMVKNRQVLLDTLSCFFL